MLVAGQGALAGKTILVTRAREQAEKTAAAIRARGARAIVLPSIELHPPKDPAAVAQALDHMAQYGWVAFTSENGVEWAWRAIEARGRASAPFGQAKLAAIGPGTAAALERHGVRVDVVAAESKGEGLARAVLAAMAADESLLLLRAEVARDVFPEALRAAGHRVDVVAVYETRPAAGPEAAEVIAQLAGGAIDAVTFTSASTVESFVGLAGGGERAKALLEQTLVASIGPITSEALVAHGVRIDAVPARSTLEALLDALEARLALPPP